jgi:hypothetical protein
MVAWAALFIDLTAFHADLDSKSQALQGAGGRG